MSKSKPVAPSPALTWAPTGEPREFVAYSPFAAYFIEGLPRSTPKANAWWLRCELTMLGGRDPMITRFVVGNHHRTLKDAQAAAEIYDVGLAHRAEEKNR